MLNKINKKNLKKELEKSNFSEVIDKYGMSTLCQLGLVKQLEDNIYCINDNRYLQLYTVEGRYLGSRVNSEVDNEKISGQPLFANGSQLTYRILLEEQDKYYPDKRQTQYTYGVVDKNGEEVISHGNYFFYDKCENGLVMSGLVDNFESKAVIISREGRIVSTDYDVLYPTDLNIDGTKFYRAGINVDGKIKLGIVAIDKECNIREFIPCEYDDIDSRVIEGSQSFKATKNRQSEILDIPLEEIAPELS